MNIGLVIYDLRSGGAERVLCKWSDLLSEENNIILYTFDGKAAPEYNYSGSLVVLDSPSKGKNKIKQLRILIKRFRLLRKKIKKDKIDVLISFCSTANFPSMLQNITRIASIRLYSEYYTYQKMYHFLIKHTKTRLVVQTDRLKKDILCEVGEKYSSRIQVIGNPLDIKKIRTDMKEEPDDTFLKKIEGKKVICFTASFKKSKNHWNLIKSFNLLHTEMPNTVLVLIGGEGELENDIHRMVENSVISDAVIFVGKTDNPFKYEKHADVFVLPSIAEGIPNVLLEAMAVGLPIVATDCLSGPREILTDKGIFEKTCLGEEKAKYGILVEPFADDINYNIVDVVKQNYYLKDAMREMLEDKMLNQYYRKMSVNRAQFYNTDNYKKQLQTIIDAVAFSKDSKA